MSNIGPLKGVLKIRVSITAKTGLHIGGSKENIEIGGIDNIVEKLKVFKPDWTAEEYYDVPYIPGSSLKGKLRSLLEWTENDKNGKIIALSYKGEPCQCGECNVCKIFGVHKAKEIKEPVRLRIEDFYPTKSTIELWERVLDSGYTEMKSENTIDRISSRSTNLRHTERVIAGSEFEGWITVRLFGKDMESQNDKIEPYQDYLCLLKTAFDMLEDDYLGGNGSRGYGRVKVGVCNFEYKEIKEGQYQKVEDSPVIENAKNILGAYYTEGREAQEANTPC